MSNTKQKTALMKVIEFIDKEQGMFKDSFVLEIKNKAKSLLQEERQQIIDSNIAGMEFIAVDPNRYKDDAEQYYNETYGHDKK